MNEPGGMVVRPYHADDIPALVALFERVFGKPITSEHWRWKLAAQLPPACNVWLAEAQGRPVFQYAGIPQRYELDGVPASALVSVDTMTDPDFRRRGLLTLVATRAYEAWREAGAAFVIGLPNQQWGSRASALGWQELFPLQWLVRPLEPQALLGRRLRMPWLGKVPGVARLWNAFFDGHLRRDSGLELREVREAGAEFDQLWSRLRTQFAFAAVRDSAWINWRFLRSPLRNYRVVAAWRKGVVAGYFAWRVIEADQHVSVQLAELVCPADDVATRDTLLLELIRLARQMRAQTISTLAIPATPLQRALKHAGFFAGPGFSVQLVPFRDTPTLEALRVRERWLMSGADYDVI